MRRTQLSSSTALQNEASTADGVAVVDNAASLQAIGKPEFAAAIWDRRIPTNIQTWLDGLKPDHLPRGRVILPAESVSETFDQLCEIARTPTGPEREWLRQDITELARIFSIHMSTAYLGLRLDVVQTDACSKFHIDRITARLICTYRGTGTEYGASPDGEDPKRVATVPTGAPILLCGALWPQTPLAGVLHRSPPIEGTGETRLVLVLDPVIQPGESQIPDTIH